MITRRAFLRGSAAALAVPALAPLAACASTSGVRAGTAISGSFFSRRRRAQTGWTVLYPPGHPAGSRLPVLVALHGRGGNHTDVYRLLHLDVALAGAVAAGTQPFAIAAADGGDHDYWHPRLHTDPAAMIVDEFLPLLTRRGLLAAPADRVGLFGWSMGGYGALYLATVLGAPRVACAIAESPAVWRHAWQTVAGAFDSPQDFREHGIFGRLRLLRGIPLRLDCGASDGFAPITRQLRAAVAPPTPDGGIEPGGHDPAYWNSQAPAQLRFAGRWLR